MQPHATTGPEGEAAVVRKRARRGRPRLLRTARAGVLLAAVSAACGGLLWLKKETPHPQAASAVREAELVEARSLSPVLETAPPAPGEAYALQKRPEAQPAPPKAEEPGTPVAALPPPPWLAEEEAGSAEALRHSLRELGARQMGSSVRFAMLKVAELLALDERAWEAARKTPAAGQNHASALLLTFYLRHLDRQGPGLDALRSALGQGMPHDRAARELVLAGRGLAEFEQGLGRAFADIGVDLQFTRRGAAVLKP